MSRTSRSILVQTILLLTCFRLEAADYTQRTWRREDGLPHGRVQAITQTADGYLWIGTAAGLVRFDGVGFAVFDRFNTPAFSEDSVLSLLAAKDGALWIGTEGGGLIRYAGRRFERHGITNAFVRSILEDRSGRLWVGTDHGAFQKRGERFERLEETPESVSQIHEDRDGRIRVLGNGVYLVNGAAAVRQTPTIAGARAIVEGADGTVLLAASSGLFTLKDSRADPITAPVVEPLRLLEDNAGATWVGASNGLFVARGTSVSPVALSEPLPSNSILALFQDRENSLWVGTGDGLVRLRRVMVTTLTARNGLAGNDVSAIARDLRNRMWAVSAAGRLYELQGQRASGVSIAGLPPDTRIRTIFHDRDGCYWIGTANHGFFRWRCGPLEAFHTAAGLPHSDIRAFLQDRAGALWIATGSGVAKLDGGKLRVFSTGDGLAYGSVRSLLETQDGEIWAGTDRGLSRIRDGKILRDQVTETLASDRIWALCQDRDGSIWAGSQGAGLYRIARQEVRGLGSIRGLPKTVHQILEDPAGNVWLSGPRGVARVRRDDLNRAADQGAGPIQVMWYGTAEGMKSVQMSGGVQPAGAIAPSGEAWFPSVQGAVAIAADGMSSSQEPLALVEEVLVDGRAVPFAGKVRIPRGARTLEVQFTAPDLISPRRIEFEYKLEGFDRDWTNPFARRAAFYTAIPPGTYRFRVIAQHRALPDRPSEAGIEVYWEPHFYQTRWFFVALALLSGSALWLGFRVYARQTRKRYALLLAERTRLAREMHDTVIQGCVGVSTLLEAASRFERTNPARLMDLVSRARKQARVTIEDARQALWDLRHDDGEAQFVESLREFARQLNEASGVPITVDVAGDSIPLEHEVNRNLLAAAREAVRNAIAHAHATEVRVSIRYEPDKVRIEVIDDGIGFEVSEPQQASGHYGLLGMRERMEQMGGSLRLISQRTRGTRVIGEMPVSK